MAEKKIRDMTKEVVVVDTALVAPSGETPREPLWLSNIDLAVPRMHTPLIYYYPAQAQAQSGALATGSFAPDRLRTALAAALVPFYPIAGRLGAGPDGRVQIDCNGEGALFVVANAADLTGADVFDDFEPSPEVRRTFVPEAEPGGPLAMFQVTFLKCGGVVLGTAIHHAAMDGVGSFQFMMTWSGVARGLDVAEARGPEPPLHDRTLLRARSPPCPSPTLDHFAYSSEYLIPGQPRPFVTRLYSVSTNLLADIKSRCGAPTMSTYCAVTAHLWRCVCVARGLAPGADTRLGVPANVRHRLCPPLPPTFCGNAVVRDVVTAHVRTVIDGSLGSVAETIKKAVDRVDDAFARSALDYLELRQSSEKKKKKNAAGDDDDGEQSGGGGGGDQEAQAPKKEQLVPSWDLWVVSWLGLAVYDADFGSGVPRLVMPAEMFAAGVVFMTPRGPDRDDGITVLMSMEPECQPCFEKVFLSSHAQCTSQVIPVDKPGHQEAGKPGFKPI